MPGKWKEPQKEGQKVFFKLPAAPGHQSLKKQESYFYVESFSLVYPQLRNRIIAKCCFYIKKKLRICVIFIQKQGYKVGAIDFIGHFLDLFNWFLSPIQLPLPVFPVGRCRG